jgi:tRNA modification GTPase
VYPGVAQADTIVAIATPPGRGGIGIVRLSGPRALLYASPLLRLSTPLEPARARFCELIDDETSLKLDDAVVTWFRAPRSYTGEDVVEIAAHGAPVVLERIVRRTLEAGARMADPGEFTARAFLSGRIDLTQAEAVRDLIEAQTLYQARIAAEQMGGALSRRIAPAKSELIALIAALEAGIDFAEDDTPVMSASAIVTVIDTIAERLTELERSFIHGRLVHSGLTLAIVGKPNVGKSSLFNRLVERERAIVTATPGTTRDPVSERVSLNGIPLELVDTAGLRDSTDEAERMGIAKSREALAEADLVLAVIDASAEPDSPEAADADRDLIASLAGRPVLIVANKSDLETNSAAVPTGAIRTSARTGEGIELLRQKIAELLQIPGTGTGSGMLTNLRQHQAILAALSALEVARQSAPAGTPHEMLLLDLYASLAQVDALTGATTSDDILNLIFSTFCIGK